MFNISQLFSIFLACFDNLSLQKFIAISDTRFGSKFQQLSILNDIYLKGIKELLDLEKRINDFAQTMDSSSKSINQLATFQEEFRIKEGYKLNEKINRIKQNEEF